LFAEQALDNASIACISSLLWEIDNCSPDSTSPQYFRLIGNFDAYNNIQFEYLAFSPLTPLICSLIDSLTKNILTF